MDTRTIIRWFLNPLVILVAFGIALLLLVITLFLLWYTRPTPVVSNPATAVLNVLPAPTATRPAPTPTLGPSPTPSLPVPPSPLPGTIGVGIYVQIKGTGGDGLRLRTDPGLQGQVRVLGAEAEVFQVKDGPKDIDGFTWWYLVGPYDSTRRGWAVANFLAVVQNP